MAIWTRVQRSKKIVRGRTRGSETRRTVTRSDRARNRARNQEEVKGNYRVLGSGAGAGERWRVSIVGAKGNMAEAAVIDGTRVVKKGGGAR